MGPTILARDRELEATARFLDAVADAPAALVLAGPAGIGKTTLWRDATVEGARRGYRVLAAHPTEAEAQLSYAALTDLVGASFDETRGVLPPAQERALAAALLRGSADDAADARIVATAFTGVLEALATEVPLLVGVDDVQWLDAASRRALEFAVRRLAGRIGVLVAERTDAGDAAPLGLRRALPEDRVRILVLGPLSMAALHHLVRQRLGTPPPRPVVARIADASGGNPFFALELARATSAKPGPLTLPPSLRELVTARLGTLSAPAREAALVAAAVTRPTSALLGRALGDDADAALDEAEAAGVLEDVDGLLRFSHPLLAAALDGFTTPAKRRQLHRRLADLVEAPEERARHLALSVTEPDEQVAHELEAAADGLALRGAQDAAAELYTAAARLTPRDRPAEVSRRLLGRATALFAVGDADEAAALASRAAESPNQLIRARAQLLHAEIMWAAGSTDNVIAELAAALVAAEGERVLEARIRARLAAFTMTIAPMQASTEASAAKRLLRPDSEPGLLAYVLFNGIFTDALLGRGARRDDLQRGLELEAQARAQATMSSIPLIWFICVDEHDAARARHEHEDHWYEERGEEFWRAERLALRASSSSGQASSSSPNR